MTTTQEKAKSSFKNGSGTFQAKEIHRMLVSGEEVLLVGKLHGAIYWKPVVILLFAMFVSLYVPMFGLIFGFVGLISLCITVLIQHYLLLAVTNKRVLARYGLLQMDVVDIRLSKIESIDLERMLPGHLFGYANVVVMGTGQRVIRIPYIANAESFRRFYNEMVLAEEGNEEVEENLKAERDEDEKDNSKNGKGKKSRSK
ncbi:MAG: PH domain-containing protein [Alphaproteobacteria bacterium]|nr:PH domain-containing protein [Alphaproteobacteria bacterium]